MPREGGASTEKNETLDRPPYAGDDGGGQGCVNILIAVKDLKTF
jgi:hypothetical protein